MSSYGTPLAQRASYLALCSSLFEPDGTVTCNYNYIVTNSNNALLIGSRCICIPNGSHTNQFGPCFKMYQKLWYIHVHTCTYIH